jgi:hypothetical protein
MQQGRTLFFLALMSLLGLTMLSGIPACSGGAEFAPGPLRPTPAEWLKGNTHTHSLWSDGDAAPEKVADWYKSHGYHFLVLSDHNIMLDGEKWRKVGTGKAEATPEHVAELQRKYGEGAVELREKGGAREMRLKTLPQLRKQFEEPDRFLFIPGEEISDKFMEKIEGKNVERPIHHISMNHEALIAPPGGTSVRDVLDRTIAAVEAEAKKSGRNVFVHLNHPNFQWGVTADDIAYAFGERFFEVYNGHRGVRNYGDKDHLSCEQIWDYVLAQRLGKLNGPPLFAFAVDDAHHHHKDQGIANPGRGWIMVRCATHSADAIVEALKRGDFYASSGVLLEDVVATKESLSIRIAAEPGIEYTTKFIGTRLGGGTGVVLRETRGPSASYPFAGDELYVRATIVSSKPHPNGYEKTDLQTAWVQPVVVRRK